MSERNAYVTLMKERALGIAPEMGCAKRMAGLISTLVQSGTLKQLRLIDIGSAAGHYLQSILKTIPSSTSIQYIGIDRDENMIAAAKEVWQEKKKQAPHVNADFIRASVDDLPHQNIEPADAVFCSNAFMYFPRPRTALTNMLHLSKRFCIIRSYFAAQTFIIKRAQPKEVHPDSDILEKDILNESGEPKKYDHWNIYSQSLIEKMVSGVDPRFNVTWEDDQNFLDSIKDENQIGIKKWEATEIWNNQEVVYPFILPWKYAIISKA